MTSLIEESRAPFALSAAARISLATSKERLLGFFGKEEAAGYVIILLQQQFASGWVAFGCKVKETKKACKGMQHGLVAGISRSPGFASTGLAVGPIGEDPAILSGTARDQAWLVLLGVYRHSVAKLWRL